LERVFLKSPKKGTGFEDSQKTKSVIDHRSCLPELSCGAKESAKGKETRQVFGFSGTRKKTGNCKMRDPTRKKRGTLKTGGLFSPGGGGREARGIRRHREKGPERTGGEAWMEKKKGFLNTDFCRTRKKSGAPPG